MIQWVVGRLIELLGPIANLQKEKRALADDALKAISKALNETYLYYRDVKAGQGPDKAREAALTHAWAAAAIPLRHIDMELSRICEYKAEYWVSPDSWDDSKIQELGIGLESVREKYRAKLKP